jgi:acyl transferase domain-containing protein
MAAVELSWEEAQSAIAGYEDRVTIAAHNSPRSVVLSGTPEAIDEIVGAMQARGVYARVLHVDIAFHSSQMDSIRIEFERALAAIESQPCSVPVYSTVTGRVNLDFSAAYWGRNLRDSVRFAEAMEALSGEGYGVYVEVSPHPVLSGVVSECVSGRDVHVLPSSRRGEERETMRRALGRLYTLGCAVDWRSVYARGGRPVSLPGYPWQRERYWLDGDGRAPAAAAKQESTERFRDWMYEVEWVERARSAEAAGSTGESWLIYADHGGVGDRLAEELVRHGHVCTVVYRDGARREIRGVSDPLPPPAAVPLRKGDTAEEPPAAASQQSAEPPAPGGGLQSAALLAAGRLQDKEKLPALEQCSVPLTKGDSRGAKRPAGGRSQAVSHRGVVYLWNLDESGASEFGLDEAADQCESVLQFIQQLATAPSSQAPRLWLVTRGAQSTGVPDEDVFPMQAPIWGLGRVFREEHPHLFGGLIDLSPGDSAPRSAQQLCAELLTSSDDDQVAFRNGTRYAPRLVRAARAEERRPAYQFRADGSYLITGGLGDLGLLLARWMVGHGARRLILLGRTALPPRTGWMEVEKGSRTERQIAAVLELEAAGAAVHLATVDVADESQLKQYLDQYRRECWPPIRGVVHAAGVLHDVALLQMDTAALNEVLRPKVAGSLALHRQLANQPLDFFVLFSSAASLLGQRGQGNYAAANAFLDALAHYRRNHGLPRRASIGAPGTKSAWPVTTGERRLIRRLGLMGIGSIFPEDGLGVFEDLQQHDVAQTIVLPIDWQRLKGFEDASRLPSLLRHLTGDPGLTGVRPTSPAAGSEGSRAVALRSARSNFQRRKTEIARTLRTPAGSSSSCISAAPAGSARSDECPRS